MNDRTGLTNEQYQQLLQPLNSNRIAKRKQAGRELSYLEAWDVKAHLIRVFGFGGFSADVLSADIAYEEQGEKNWSVGYKVVLRLVIHATGATYTEAAVGSAQLPQRGEAHDMAVKTAESDALKRAAINLGTQFGLSLYDNGSRADVIGRTLAPPVEFVAPLPLAAPNEPEIDTEAWEGYAAQIASAVDEITLKGIYDATVESGIVDVRFLDVTLRELVVDRLAIIREASND